MIPTVVSSLILMKRRMIIDVFPPVVRKLWKEWELRALVFFSLASQILLIVLGNRRKYMPQTWVKAVVWSAYLLADSVATTALGLLLNDLGEINEKGGNQLTAFWAPFFLLHLGGPDTITAYSLEDNELYLRHAFQLIYQTLVAILIFLLAWNGSQLSILAIPMIIVGFIKYGEKTLTLWSVSSNQLRESVLSSTTADSNYPKILDESPLYLAEGYEVEKDFMIDAPPFKIDMPESGAEFSDDQKIVLAHVLFDTFKCLFADLNTSDVDRQSIESLLKGMTQKADAFDVIAIELGFVYDLLYTKSIVIHSPWGIVRRVTTTFLTFAVLLIFPFVEKGKHLKLDVGITFFLLTIAVFLEIYAAVVLFFSDQSRNWFIGYKKINAILRLIQFLEPWVTAPRWSNSMGQFSFTSLCIIEKSSCIIPRLRHAVKQVEKLPFLGKLILKMHRYMDKLLEQQLYKTSSKDVTGDLKKLIFKHVKSEHDQFEEDTGTKGNLRELRERAFKDFQKEHDRDKENGRNDTNLKELFELTFNRVKKDLDQFNENRDNHTKASGSRALEKHNMLKWSVEVKFDERILIWHIATEICYYEDKVSRVPTTDQSNAAKLSMFLSKYMMYLLVKYPLLLPVGLGGVVRRRDTLSEIKEYFKRKKISLQNFQSEIKPEDDAGAPDDGTRRISAWKQLRELSIEVKEDSVKSVLYNAHKLALQLTKISDWETVQDVWLEMLTYAASQSRGSQHAAHLRRGGELLTHVWLLMAQFGMTEQFQISKSHGIPFLIVK